MFEIIFLADSKQIEIISYRRVQLRIYSFYLLILLIFITIRSYDTSIWTWLMVMSSHAAAENDKMVVVKLPWKAQHNWQFFGQIFCQDRKRNIECQKCLQWTRFCFFSLHPSPCGWYRANERVRNSSWWLRINYLNFLKARALLENKKIKK